MRKASKGPLSLLLCESLRRDLSVLPIAHCIARKTNIVRVFTMDLFTASGAGDLDLVRKLIEEGANPDLGDSWTGEY